MEGGRQLKIGIQLFRFLHFHVHRLTVVSHQSTCIGIKDEFCIYQFAMILQKPVHAIESTACSLTWSHYVRLLTVVDPEARQHYEDQAIRGDWSVRQLDRQISALAYQRSRPIVPSSSQDKRESTAGTEIKDPFVLEFLGLKDDYSEADLEKALICELEQFLLELGNEFASLPAKNGSALGTNGTGCR
jgi:hypothetical protein